MVVCAVFLLYALLIFIIFKNSAHASHRTHSLSIIKPSRLNKFREKIALYYAVHMNRINSLCGKNVEGFSVETGGAYDNHWTLMGYSI
jgi:hypothetical protein